MFSRLRKSGRPKGFLLLELSLAMVLLSIALVGLLDGHRAVIAGRSSNSQHALLRFLLEQRLATLEDAASYKTGVENGVFEQNSDCEWKVETRETKVSALFRANVTVSRYGQSVSGVIYLRDKSAGGTP